MMSLLPLLELGLSFRHLKLVCLIPVHSRQCDVTEDIFFLFNFVLFSCAYIRDLTIQKRQHP